MCGVLTQVPATPRSARSLKCAADRRTVFHESLTRFRDLACLAAHAFARTAGVATLAAEMK